MANGLSLKATRAFDRHTRTSQNIYIYSYQLFFLLSLYYVYIPSSYIQYIKTDTTKQQKNLQEKKNFICHRKSMSIFPSALSLDGLCASLRQSYLSFSHRFHTIFFLSICVRPPLFLFNIKMTRPLEKTGSAPLINRKKT